jgi:hypothetical protein
MVIMERVSKRRTFSALSTVEFSWLPETENGKTSQTNGATIFSGAA